MTKEIFVDIIKFLFSIMYILATVCMACISVLVIVDFWLINTGADVGFGAGSCVVLSHIYYLILMPMLLFKYSSVCSARVQAGLKIHNDNRSREIDAFAKIYTDPNASPLAQQIIRELIDGGR